LSALILDTNLLVLFVVSIVSPHRIQHHKLTSEFQQQDVKLLYRYLDAADRVLTTPNIMTEASNLLNISERRKTDVRYAAVLAQIARSLPERYVPSANAVNRAEFSRLGLTDTVLLEVLGDGGVLFSSDGALCRAVEASGLRAVNFWRLRDASSA
jgi:hypothetical protein